MFYFLEGNLRVIILLFVLTGINNNSIAEQCIKFYKCDSSDLSIFIMAGANIKCPDDKFCNFNYVIPGDQVNQDRCVPCLKKNCPFKCINSNETLVEIAKETYICNNDYKCNKEQKKNCDPCIHDICEAKEIHWTCVSETEFILDNMKGKCLKGHVCKRNKKPPCDNPCIEDLNSSRPTTTENPNTTITNFFSSHSTQSTSKVVTTLSTTKASLDTTTETSSTTPKKTTTSLVALRTTIQARITTPPLKLPNCNDGHGDTNPCRPGNKNSYFKCKYYSPVWNDYENKLCKDIARDPVCIGKVC